MKTAQSEREKLAATSKRPEAAKVLERVEVEGEEWCVLTEQNPQLSTGEERVGAAASEPRWIKCDILDQWLAEGTKRLKRIIY